ncbi:hypothetical protein JHK87_003002 [Glycine soja]|nr:hypothetical protein JHK87_003002 [Glycine soja]
MESATVSSSESETALPLPLASESQQPYVSELLSFTLDRLHKEPELLRVDADRIRRQMQEVAVGNYRSFIAAADALIAIRQEVSSIDNHLESLFSNQSLALSHSKYSCGPRVVDKKDMVEALVTGNDLCAFVQSSIETIILCSSQTSLSRTQSHRAFVIEYLSPLSQINEIPKLTSGCTEFIESAERILEKRKMNQTMLTNHSTLLDLLEIPQLMDTCVRNGNYDEALDLEAFVGKLSTMHPKLPVIQALAADVRLTTQSLLSQLLQKLRSNIQLPECLRIIGYLRRIGVFSEYGMRLLFLRCREAWLTGILEDLDQANPYEYLKGMINCHRMHLFDVVNQYRAIFADDTSGSEENYDGGLLFSWAMHQITSHLQTLKVMLPKITEGGSLSNILDQCMLVLDSHRWVPLPGVGFSAHTVGDENHEDVTPPSNLMEHPPLAVFINGVSAAMNELRPCAPISLKHVLAQELIKGLQAVSDSLLLYSTTRVLRSNESGLFLSLCRAFIEAAYPHCATCFGRCYLGGATLIMDAKNVYNGISRLLETSSARELPKPVNNAESKSVAENGESPKMENGETPDAKESEAVNSEEVNEEGTEEGPTLQTDREDTNLEKPLE